VARVRQAQGGDLEVLQAVDDAIGVLAGDSQLVRVVAADRHEDRVVALVLEVVQAEVAAQGLVADEPPAEARDALVLGIEHPLLRQPVLRDPVAEHPAGRLVPLVDRHVVAGDQQVVGRGYARRAGAR